MACLRCPTPRLIKWLKVANGISDRVWMQCECLHTILYKPFITCLGSGLSVAQCTGFPPALENLGKKFFQSGNLEILLESQEKLRVFCQSGKSMEKLDQKIIQLFHVVSLKTIISRQFWWKSIPYWEKHVGKNKWILREDITFWYISVVSKVRALLGWNWNLIWSHRHNMHFWVLAKIQGKNDKYWKSRGISWEEKSWSPQCKHTKRHIAVPCVSSKTNGYHCVIIFHPWTCVSGCV